MNVVLEKIITKNFIDALKTIFEASADFAYPERLKMIAEQFPEAKRTLPGIIVSLSGLTIKNDYLGDFADTIEAKDSQGKSYPLDLKCFVISGTANFDCITQDNVSCRELTQEVLNCFLTPESGYIYYAEKTDEIIPSGVESQGIWVLEKSIVGERQEPITESEFLWINQVRVNFEYEVLLIQKEVGYYELYSITPIIY